MDSRYAFSMDGNVYQGSYATRKEAYAAAVKAARQLSETPGVFFVGRVRPIDPQASDHARHVLQEMNRRFRDLTGEARYLLDITDQQRQDLDQRLEQTIRQWLLDNGLLPHGQRVESISEYPLPACNGAVV